MIGVDIPEQKFFRKIFQGRTFWENHRMWKADREEGITVAVATSDMESRRDIFRHIGVDTVPFYGECLDAVQGVVLESGMFPPSLFTELQSRRLPTLLINDVFLWYGSIFGRIRQCPDGLVRHTEQDAKDGCIRHAVYPSFMGSQIIDYLGDRIDVTSDHRECVSVLPSSMCASAMTDDGLIEAGEWLDTDWWFVGVQWKLFESRISIPILYGLIEACQIRITNHSGESSELDRTPRNTAVRAVR